MKTFISRLFCLLSLLLLAGTAYAQRVSPGNSGSTIVPIDPETVKMMLEQPLQREFVPGQVIVKFKSSTLLAPQSAISALGLETKPTPTSGEGEYVYSLSTTSIRSMSQAMVAKRTLELVQTLGQRADVQYSQPNYLYYIQATPNDTRYPEQWHYFDQGNGPNQAPGGINLPTRWDTGKGGTSIVVAVIDTGILPNHPDIAGSANLIPGYDMISILSIANDGNGRDSDSSDPGDAIAAGECFPGSPARPSSWHGTHVAGTIGVGKTDNSTGVAGANWQVSVQAVRVLGKCGGTSQDINDAIRWAAGLNVPGVPANRSPARVINMSLGGQQPCSASPATQSAISDAFNAGTTVVVAAGNSRQDAANFQPAGCDNVITVAASDYRGHLATRYSNFGNVVEIMAPGGDVSRDDNNDGNPDGVLSTIQGGYAYYNGTSMAAPHVAGVAALLLSDDFTRTPQQIADLIKNSATPRSSVECPRPCGAGLLSATAPTGIRLNVSPISTPLTIAGQATITATLTDGGQPLRGRVVSFRSLSDTVARIASADSATDTAGSAQVTLEGVAAGNTTVVVTAEGIQKNASVSVSGPAVPIFSPWSLAILIGLILAAAYRRMRVAY